VVYLTKIDFSKHLSQKRIQKEVYQKQSDCIPNASEQVFASFSKSDMEVFPTLVDSNTTRCSSRNRQCF